MPRWSRAIKNHRMMLGMTQQEFADMVGVSRYAVIQWEHGVMPKKSCKALLKKNAGIGDWAYEDY